MTEKNDQTTVARRAFTLIELLVVISIMSVLASMMLPGLNRGKQKAVIIRCLSNLRQIGIGVQLYVDDYDSKFPLAYAIDPVDRLAKNTRSTLGGFDPRPDHLPYYPSARGRPLFDYVQPSEVYRCARDSGRRGEPCLLPVKVEPTSWQALGCSYEYNAGNLTFLQGGGFKKTPVDEANGLAGKREGWVGDPSRYVLLHEPPARLYCGNGPWYQWHYARSRTEFADATIAPAQFISPIAYVDGHAAIHNFSRSLQTDPYYPYEETKDWVWYKPTQ